MKNSIKLPNWKNEIGSDINGIVLTDDIDSLFSYYLLKQKFPTLEVVGFYDFKTLKSNSNFNFENSLWIDCDMMKPYIKSIGNHRITKYKENNINLNMLLNDSLKKDYKYKFPFSTALTVLYLFFDTEEIDSMSDDILKLIIAIDSAFLGYYKDNGKWRKYHEYWLKQLKFDRVHEILKNSTFEEFKNIQSLYNLESKISYSEGLSTNIDLLGIMFDFEIDLYSLIESVKLPKIKMFKHRFVNFFELEKIKENSIVSMAETYSGKFAITCL